MFISKTISYFKEKPLRALILILVVLSIISIALRLFTPATQRLSEIPLPQLQTLRQTTLQNSEISIDLSQIPVVDTYDVFQAQSTHLTIDALGQKLRLHATDFKNTWQDQTKHQSLVFDPYSHRFNYSNTLISGDFDASTVLKINKEQTIQKAMEFAQMTLEMKGLVVQQNDIQYFTKSPSHPEESDAQNGNVILIPFSYDRNSFVFYSGIDFQPPLIVFIDSTNMVTGFTASEYFFTLGKSTPVSALQADAVIGELKSGNFSIISIQSIDPTGFDLKDVRKLTADAVKIEYRFSTDAGIAVPYYRISATVELESIPTPIQLVMITPAVQTSVGKSE